MITPAMAARHIARLLREPVRLKLYTSIVNENGIVEVVGAGYRDVPITFRDWRITTATVTPFAEAGPYEFRFDGSREFSVGGAYIVEDVTDALLWIQPFGPEPFRISRAGDTVPVIARFSLTALGDAADVRG